jgi:hypothetical protein
MKTSQLQFGKPVPGQGGVLAAIMRGRIVNGAEEPPYALLVAPRDVGDLNDTRWAKEGVSWGHLEEVEGCTSRTDGKANTAAMLAAECPAAIKVTGLEHEGHKDYYVPSLGELNAAAGNVPEQFDSNGVYWTSTQTSRYFAFVQGFEDGYSGWSFKVYERRVRAFRQIPLELLIA